MDRNAPRAHPQEALAVYVEPLAVGRRVLVIGDSSLGLGTRLAELGARAVCVWDPDPVRASREAERAPLGVIVRALAQGSASEGLRPRGQTVDEMDERSGSFDLAVIGNLELFDDAEDLLARVRRLVGDHGVALVAAPNREGTANPDAFDYYELFDLVAREFEDVTMIAQLPFFGVALAELGEKGDESPTVSVDTQLASGDRSPDAFVALASQSGVRLDPYAIVELPSRPPAAEDEEDEEEEQAEADAAELEILRASLAEARLRAGAVEGQVAELASRFAEGERESLAAQRALEEALRDRSLRVVELETALGQGKRQLTHLSDEIESVRATIHAERVDSVALGALLLRAEHAELALRSFEPELARLGDAHALEVAQYEEALRERAKEIRALRVELDRRERMVRDLVGTLDEGAHKDASQPTPSEKESGGESSERDLLADKLMKLQHKLDALALDLARREGEAQASVWTIAELERRLESGSQGAQGAQEAEGTPFAGTGDKADKADKGAEQRLAAALDELDVLRRALAQEHEARLRAESNQKFAGGGEEVQEQPH
jgi:SAM-dependent methyltransferase